MKTRFAAYFALALALGAFLSAGPASADPVYDKCIDRTATNAEWAGCGAEYLERLDRALNIAWKKAISSLDDQKTRAELLAEQRAWIKFRDASCQIYANGYFGREGQVLHFVGCRAAIIEARISDLKGVYELTHQDSK
jgi:uncharacterized protein YecT (DUF1311 family)